MRKIALGIKTTAALLIAAVVLAIVAGWVPRGPMNHGWDWPWHDWWHSQPQSSQIRQHAPAADHIQMAGSIGDHASIRSY